MRILLFLCALSLALVAAIVALNWQAMMAIAPVIERAFDTVRDDTGESARASLVDIEIEIDAEFQMDIDISRYEGVPKVGRPFRPPWLNSEPFRTAAWYLSSELSAAARHW